MEHVILQEILILLAVAVVAVAIVRRFNLPPILGYLFVGVLVGPHGVEWIPDTEDTRFLAEFGVVFLLFTIGLEFSLPQLVAMRRIVLGLGGAQVVLVTGLAGLIAWLLGMQWQGAVVVGGIVALSSTAIVTKQLTEQLEINSRHGRTAVGILLFQDLAVIPFLIIIPILAGEGGGSVGTPLLVALGKGVFAFLVMLALGHWALRPLFREVASARSSELFMLTVLLVSLTAAWATHYAGLSLALGGFLAGVMLGETEYRHQVEADIRGFRDVLLGLFFITIGMLLDVRAVAEVLHWALLVTAGIVLGKTLLITALSRLSGVESGVALRAGLVLAQGGEFGFALLALAMGAALIGDQAGQIVLASVFLSMALSPLLIRYNGHLAKLLSRSYVVSRAEAESDIAAASHGLEDHVIICGYGRVGQHVARLLEREGFAYVALDLDPARVEQARAAGENVNYGHSTHPEILAAAGLERARVLVVSYDDPPSTVQILAHAREQRPDIPILVRTRDDSHLDEFQQLGATEIIPETLEASLMLGAHLFYLLDVPVSSIVRRVRDVRAERYRTLRGFFPGEELPPLEESESQRGRLLTATLPEDSYAVGRTLGELHLEDTGVTITAVRHHGHREVAPKPDLQLQEGDTLVLYGTPENLERMKNALLSARPPAS